MLQHLSIKNYALIDTLELELRDGFSVITGETGAGKSIILGALNLVLGKRADLKVLKDETRKCTVEGSFHLKENENIQFFKENDLDFEIPCIIRREILPSGKSRAFINDTPVNLNVLSELAEKVIDVHSQHQTLFLTDNKYQLQLLDSFARNDKERENYKLAYTDFKGLLKEKESFAAIIEKESGDVDYISFLLNELKDARLEVGEQELIEEELKLLENIEEIQSNLTQVSQLAEGDETNGVRAGLQSMYAALRNLNPYHSDYENLAERLESLRIELDDILQEVEQKSADTDFEPGRLEKLDTRLSQIITLQKKHGVNSIEDLILKREELEKKIDTLANVEEKMAELDQKLQLAQQRLKQCARLLHESRKKIVPEIEKELGRLLVLLNMPHASFTIDVSLQDQFKSSGADEISYYFTANKGQQPQALAKIASGGEMSRVMLALKAIMARKNDLPTIIFDEIDTGVSGETAGKIGNILKEMGGLMQVIAISHLPQIASKGSEHYKVVKVDDKDTTTTTILHLSLEERLRELARLLSGEQISEAALANARNLLQQEV